MCKKIRLFLVAVLLPTMVLFLYPATVTALSFKPPQPGDKAPDFTLSAPSGGRYTLSDSWMRDQHRVTIVSFYSFTCKACIKELKHLQKFKAQLSAGSLNVIVVIVDPDSKMAVATLDKKGVRLPLVSDSLGIVAKRYGLKGQLPSCYIIDDKGTFIKRTCGSKMKTLKDLEKEVWALLNK